MVWEGKVQNVEVEILLQDECLQPSTWRWVKLYNNSIMRANASLITIFLFKCDLPFLNPLQDEGLPIRLISSGKCDSWNMTRSIILTTLEVQHLQATHYRLFCLVVLRNIQKLQCRELENCCKTELNVLKEQWTIGSSTSTRYTNFTVTLSS